MTGTNFKCGLEAVLAILGGKWKPLILYHLTSGAKRTGQLRRLVTNVSEKMLIQHLKEMADDGVIRRIDFQTVSPHVSLKPDKHALHGLRRHERRARQCGVGGLRFYGARAKSIRSDRLYDQTDCVSVARTAAAAARQRSAGNRHGSVDCLRRCRRLS